MGYVLVIVIAVLVVPLLFMMLSRRTTSGGGVDSRDRGVTVSQPSSDQPTPRADGTNRAAPGADRKLPPG
jgi:hypothetical protein